MLQPIGLFTNSPLRRLPWKEGKKKTENEEKVPVCINVVQRKNLSFGPINN